MKGHKDSASVLGSMDIDDAERRFLTHAAREAVWPASGPHKESDQLGLLSWVYFVALARENHKAEMALMKEASERFGATPIMAGAKVSPAREEDEAQIPHVVAEEFPGILKAFWENLDIIDHLDQSDQLAAFCCEVAGLMGEEFGFGDFGERIVKEPPTLTLVEDPER